MPGGEEEPAVHLLDNPPLANPEVLVVREEFEPLSDVVCASFQPTPGIQLLWKELQRARLVDSTTAPPDLVRIGASVEYTDIINRESRIVRLVHPRDAISSHRISYASSLGAALLGLRSGQSFRWYAPGGRLRVVRVDHVRPPADDAEARLTSECA